MKIKIANVIAALLFLPFLMGFTVLSGPQEATLPVSADSPQITFKWNGSAPTIEGKGSFDDGRFSELEDEEFMSELLNQAFGLWNDVKGSYLEMLIERDDEVDTDDSDEEYSVVVEGGLNASAVAFANPQIDSDTDVINDCDIVISNATTDAEDLANTIAHEVGHCLGLGHNHTNYNALMGYSRTDKSLSLGLDDRAGIIYLYPDPEFKGSVKELPGCGVLSESAEGFSGGILLLLVIFFPLLFVRRRAF